VAKEQALTPMLQQYQQIKAQYSESILFFRLGDFYEMFYEDAAVAARELELVLTSRATVPMCGIPYHAADSYLARLVNKGYKVAICEQVEDPRKAKGIVRREVTRVVTPGTVIDEKALPERGNNYLAAIINDAGSWGLAWADISTGEFFIKLCRDIEELTDELVRLVPAEYLLPPQLSRDNTFCRRLQLYSHGVITTWPMETDLAAARQQLNDRFNTGIAVDNMAPATCLAAALLVTYLTATQHNSLAHLQAPQAVTAKYIPLDPANLYFQEVQRQTAITVLNP
jgi:DNA mismatch repair protein MutS